MKAEEIFTQVRSVECFDRVTIQSQHINKLLVTQGDREALTIQAPREVLNRITSRVKDGRLVIRLGGSWMDRLQDALTTSLNRPTIKYSLMVKQLSSLEAHAIMDMFMDRLVSDQLNLVFGGMGQIELQSLQADGLSVELTGAGRVDIAGQVGEQCISIRGMGEYHAPELESRTASIHLNGPGKAIVWASEKLEVDIRGPGLVYYYGDPKIERRIAPIGVLSRLYRESAYS